MEKKEDSELGSWAYSEYMEERKEKESRLQNRRTAAECVSRIFSGKGDMIIDLSTKTLGTDKIGSFDDYEKALVKEFFYFILNLIEEEKD